MSVENQASLFQAVEFEQAEASTSGINLLDQSQLEGAVIIYDTDSQGIVKLVTSTESADNSESIDNSIDMDNLITLHASVDTKEEESEEANTNLSTVHEPKIDFNSVVEENIKKESIKKEQEELEEKEPEELKEEDKDEDEDDDDDDETIATFVTSSGQRLALYAVENTDQVFAVALYDESGANPDNFHFVMKDDVERLIQEGAVRTVKKKSAKPVQLQESQAIQENDGVGFNITSDVKPVLETNQEIPPSKDALSIPKTLSEPEITLNSNFSPKQETLQIHESPENQGSLSIPTILPQQTTELNQDTSPKQEVTQLKESPVKPEIPIVEESVKTLESPVPKPTPEESETQSVPQTPTKVSAIQQLFTSIPESPPKQINPLEPTTPPLQTTSIPTSSMKSTSPPKQISPVQEIVTKSVIPQKLPSSVKQVPPTKPALTLKQEFLPKRSMEIRREIVQVPSPKKIQNVQKPNATYNKIQCYGNKILKNNVTKIPIQRSQINKSIGNVSNVQSNRESISYIVTDKNEAYILDRPQEIDSDTEILEQSTVQYILGDGNSDDELTYDELQRSLQSFKKPSNNSEIVIKPKPPEPLKQQPRTIVKFGQLNKSTAKITPILVPRKPAITTKSTTFTKAISLAPLIKKTYSRKPIINRPPAAHNIIHVTNLKIKKELLDDLMMEDDDESFFADDSNVVSGSETDTSKIEMVKVNSVKAEIGADGSRSGPAKIKRPRKQQLTVVNRPDSEIIIQQASVYSEEDEEDIEPVISKKRGRRKKRPSPDPEYNPRKMKKKSKRLSHAYEVIDIDVDESESNRDGSAASTSTATGTGGKTKGSSDKENNDVISLSSSEDNDREDDEDEDEEEDDDEQRRRRKQATRKTSYRYVGKNSGVQCKNCSRSFMNLRSLTTHQHTCRKKGSDNPPMRFKCKTCGEPFDAAVTLARHVRITHTPRKRVGRPAKGWSNVDGSDTTTSEPEEDEEDPSVNESSEHEPEPKRKKRGRPPSKKRILIEESAASDSSLKPESSNEPKKRVSAPPSRKSAANESSMSVDVDEKSSSQVEQPRKRGRPRKNRSISVSKIERSMSPEADKEKSDQAIAQIPKKRGKALRRTIWKNEQSEVEKKTDDGDDVPVQPAKRGRPRKRSASKDEKFVSSGDEEKSKTSARRSTSRTKDVASEDSQTEIGNENNAIEAKDTDKEKTENEAVDEKSTKDGDKEDDNTDSKDDDNRGDDDESATKKTKSSKLEEDSSVEEKVDADKDKPADCFEAEEKGVSAIKESSESQTKENPMIEKSSLETKSSEVVEKKEKAESLVATTPTEPRRRGRPPKDRSLKIARTLESEEKLENKPMEPEPLKDEKITATTTEEEEDEKKKKNSNLPSEIQATSTKLTKTEDTAASSPVVVEKKHDTPTTECRKRGRPAKDRSRKDSVKQESEIFDVDEVKKNKSNVNDDKDDNIEDAEPVKRKKETLDETLEKNMDVNDSLQNEDDDNDDDEDDDKKLLPNTSRSWKVKKLNCSDCGKWFSSAAALDTHRLQHRTKKTSKVVKRCQICKNFVPVEMFAKHMTTAHKKPITVGGQSTSSSAKPLLQQQQQAITASGKRLVRSVVVSSTSINRSNVRQLRSSN